MTFNFEIIKRRLVGIVAVGALSCGLVIASMPFTASAAEYGKLPKIEDGQKVAIFAGGCFWCVESDFDKIPGVIATTSGYIGGSVTRPSYKQVSYTETGHYEAVHIVYDPEKVSYDKLLTAFWHSVDPTDDGGQFCDRGTSYKSAVFAVDDAQREAAESSKDALEAAKVLDDPIVTPILDVAPFYPAESYHQDYYKKSSLRYSLYRNGCGRDRRVREVWGDMAFKGIKDH